MWCHSRNSNPTRCPLLLSNGHTRNKCFSSISRLNCLWYVALFIWSPDKMFIYFHLICRFGSSTLPLKTSGHIMSFSQIWRLWHLRSPSRTFFTLLVCHCFFCPSGPRKLPLCLCKNSTFERQKIAVFLFIYSTFESISKNFSDIPIPNSTFEAWL